MQKMQKETSLEKVNNLISIIDLLKKITELELELQEQLEKIKKSH